MHEDNVAVSDTACDKVVDLACRTAGVIGGVERPETELNVHSSDGVEDFHVEVASGRSEESCSANP